MSDLAHSCTQTPLYSFSGIAFLSKFLFSFTNSCFYWKTFGIEYLTTDPFKPQLKKGDGLGLKDSWQEPEEEGGIIFMMDLVYLFINILFFILFWLNLKTIRNFTSTHAHTYTQILKEIFEYLPLPTILNTDFMSLTCFSLNFCFI